LNLTVLSGDTARVEQSISTAELPYEYQGKVYPVGTKPGVYVDTINVTTGNCDDVIILTLTITQSTVGVDNLSAADLTMVPNPVRVSEALTIEGEFSAAEREGMVVSIYNAIGQKVYEVEPTTDSIVIEGLQQRGVYIVRVTTGTGEHRQGKIIVE
jgi:hypothetical protein